MRMSAMSCRCSLLAANTGEAKPAASARNTAAVVNRSFIPLFCRDYEVRAPVLCERRLIMAGVEGKLLAVADGPQPISRDAKGDEIRAGRHGTALAEREVV